MISSHIIREARLRAGLTQAQLGERSGKAGSMIGRWERGKVAPSLETVVGLVRACGFELGLTLSQVDDHDWVLIRRSLRLDPPMRLASLVSEVRALDAMAEAAHG